MEFISVFLKQLKNTRVCFEINMISLTHKHYDLTFHGTKGCIYKYTQQYVYRSTTCNFFISHLHYNIIYTVLCVYEINIVKCQKGIHDENDAFSRYKQQINFIALVTRVLRYQNMTISPSIYSNIKY